MSSSLSRRSVRTTAAAAGIAALGAGFVGTASAAPSETARPETGGPDALRTFDTRAVEGLLTQVPNAPATDISELPPIFTFEGPTVNTSSAETPSLLEAGLSEAPEISGLPAPSSDLLEHAGVLEHIGNIQGGSDQLNVPEVSSFTGDNQAGALPSLDTARMLAELAEQATSADSLAQNRNIG
jgi:hypothetical protein